MNAKEIRTVYGRGTHAVPGAAPSGFTLVELLVVIAIIGVLISLLLPAVNAAREAARRTHCKNNMMQISIALANYEANHEMLPPGTIDPTGPIQNTATGYHMGWIVQILPQLGELNAFKHVDFSASVYDKKNDPVGTLVLSTLICPSDRQGPVSGTGRAMSNYAGCHHDVEAPIDVTNNGVLFLNSQVRESQITDGASHTLFVGEKLNDPKDLGWMSGTRATLRNTGSAPNATPAWLLPTVTPPSPGTTTAPAVPGDGDGTTADADPTKASNLVNLLYVGGFSSAHPGGINCALGDGSVQFISDSISTTTFQQLGHRADGALTQPLSW